MRLLMILFYYAVAFLLGFYARGRYDEFIYRTPHMQRRLRRWADYVVAPAPESAIVLPLSTLDAPAFQPEQTVDAVVVPSPPGPEEQEGAEPRSEPPVAIEPR